MRNYAYPLFCALALAALSSYSSAATEYEVDASHSSVGFEVKHLISQVQGAFTDFSGDLSFDPKKPADSKLNAKVKTASINTFNTKRDDHLRSPDFFDAKKFPELSFVSKTVTPAGENKYKVEGELTLHGKTNKATFDVEYLGETKDPQGNPRLGFVATTSIDRKAYDIVWNKKLDQGGYVLGDDVKIKINVEAVKKAEAAPKKPAPAKKAKAHS